MKGVNIHRRRLVDLSGVCDPPNITTLPPVAWDRCTMGLQGEGRGGGCLITINYPDTRKSISALK